MKRSISVIASAVILSILVMLSALYYWPIQEPYHPLNTDWNGCSEIAGRTNSTLLTSYNAGPPKAPMLAIIGPSLPFSASDAAYLRNYLEGNGTIVLADDFGSGNTLLQELNVSVRFAQEPLADLYSFSKQPSFPLLSVPPSNIASDFNLVVLNHPSFLEISNLSQVIVVASSSPFSFIDIHGDGRPAQNESVGAYPVMAYVHVQAGVLLLISDSSIFVNEMIEFYDNMRLFADLVKFGGGFLMFDVSHLANAPVTNTHITLRDAVKDASNALRNSYVQVALVALVVALALPYRFAKKMQRRSIRSDSHVLYSNKVLK